MKQYSRITDQGTAMSEATLCEEHFVQPYIDYANYDADSAEDASTDRQWYDSSENDYVTCYECGLNAVAERLDRELGR
ncbi:hypothetical protein DQP57_00265 [Mycobacterium colombiense]|uniref:Uncharacterized protein n=1 Tax=Mycobacterium colombiense TaxID=339268 RepID=A0A329MBP4_9MYCO|nr:hypothetical protein DQP57_00265 [Mycobacterium colombiense]